MASIQTAADNLLICESKLGSFAVAENTGLTPEQFASHFSFLRAYQQLLWEIVTASADDLTAFSQLLFDFDGPYVELPPAIQVSVLRLAGLQRTDNASFVELMNSGIDVV